MSKSNKLLITVSQEGDILSIDSTVDAQVLVVVEREDGGFTSSAHSARKLGRVEFREHAWDALAAGIDSKAAQEYDISMKGSTLQFLQNL